LVWKCSTGWELIICIIIYFSEISREIFPLWVPGWGLLARGTFITYHREGKVFPPSGVAWGLGQVRIYSRFGLCSIGFLLTGKKK